MIISNLAFIIQLLLIHTGLMKGKSMSKFVVVIPDWHLLKGFQNVLTVTLSPWLQMICFPWAMFVYLRTEQMTLKHFR